MFMGCGGRNEGKPPNAAMSDAELFHHIRRMSRLTRALQAPLDRWEAEVLQRVRAQFDESTARRVRLQLDEVFIELVITIDNNIGN